MRTEEYDFKNPAVEQAVGAVSHQEDQFKSHLVADFYYDEFRPSMDEIISADEVFLDENVLIDVLDWRPRMFNNDNAFEFRPEDYLKAIDHALVQNEDIRFRFPTNLPEKAMNYAEKNDGDFMMIHDFFTAVQQFADPVVLPDLPEREAYPDKWEDVNEKEDVQIAEYVADSGALLLTYDRGFLLKKEILEGMKVTSPEIFSAAYKLDEHGNAETEYMGFSEVFPHYEVKIPEFARVLGANPRLAFTANEYFEEEPSVRELITSAPEYDRRWAHSRQFEDEQVGRLYAIANVAGAVSNSKPNIEDDRVSNYFYQEFDINEFMQSNGVLLAYDVYEHMLHQIDRTHPQTQENVSHKTLYALIDKTQGVDGFEVYTDQHSEQQLIESYGEPAQIFLDSLGEFTTQLAPMLTAEKTPAQIASGWGINLLTMDEDLYKESTDSVSTIPPDVCMFGLNTRYA